MPRLTSHTLQIKASTRSKPINSSWLGLSLNRAIVASQAQSATQLLPAQIKPAILANLAQVHLMA